MCALMENHVSNEQLKMILDALTSMGAEGKEAFIWWLITNGALPVFGWVACVLIAALVIRSVVLRLNPPPERKHPSLGAAQDAYEAARRAWLYSDDQGGLSSAYKLYEAAEAYAKAKGLKT